jgi:hypothetical protein
MPARKAFLWLLAMLLPVFAGHDAAGTTVTGGAVLSVQTVTAIPATIAFGDITVGQSRTATITISNSKSTSSTIFAASVSGPGFAVTGLSLPLTLAPGQSQAFRVSFSPSNAGAAAGAVYLQSSVSGNLRAIITVALSGIGTPPAHSVDLSWNPSTSQVIGYNVYRGLKSGGPYNKINSALTASTIFDDSQVQGGATYYYVVTAVDASDTESGYSNEAAAVVPRP